MADDLLKNDGQKFLEMMESLADKRIQREREAMEAIIAEEDEDDECDGKFCCALESFEDSDSIPQTSRKMGP